MTITLSDILRLARFLPKAVDIVKGMCYNHHMEAITLTDRNKVKYGHNDELGFLYKKLSLITPSSISHMIFVPEYIEALKTSPAVLDDKTVYEIIKSTYKKLLAENKDSRNARYVMTRVSREVMGDSTAWQND